MSGFLSFVIVLFVLAALLRIDFFFTILYLFTGIFLLLHVWSRRMLGQLEFRRCLAERAFLGDTVAVTLKVDNRSWLPVPWLLLSESLPVALTSPALQQMVVSLAGKGHHEFHYRLDARQRGYYKVGPLRLEAGDLLGLKRELTGRFDASFLIVYPKILPMPGLKLPAHSPQMVLATPLPLFYDPARMIGVRGYEQGDNPRHIHWPASASTGQTMVKQFQPAIARDNTIFLNLDREDYARHAYPDPSLELAITTAASLAYHIVTVEKLPVGLTTLAFDPLAEEARLFVLPPRKGRQQLVQILEVLARVQAAGSTGFLERVRRAAVHLSWGTTVTLITDSLESEELLKTVLLLKRSGFPVALAQIYPARVYAPAGPKQIKELGIPVYQIQREKDVERWSPAR